MMCHTQSWVLLQEAKSTAPSPWLLRAMSPLIPFIPRVTFPSPDEMTNMQYQCQVATTSGNWTTLNLPGKRLIGITFGSENIKKENAQYQSEKLNEAAGHHSLLGSTPAAIVLM